MQDRRAIQLVHLIDTVLACGFAEVADDLAVDFDVDFFGGHGSHEDEGVEEAVESFVVDIETHVFDDVLDQE